MSIGFLLDHSSDFFQIRIRYSSLSLNIISQVVEKIWRKRIRAMDLYFYLWRDSENLFFFFVISFLFARICFSLPLFYIAERSLIGWGNAIGNYSNRVSRLLKVRRTKPMQLHLNKHRCIDMQWTPTNKRNFFIRTRARGFRIFRANNRPAHSKREHVFELHTWFINKTINKGNKDPSGRLCGGCDEAWEITLEKRKNFFSSSSSLFLFFFLSFLFFFLGW